MTPATFDWLASLTPEERTAFEPMLTQYSHFWEIVEPKYLAWLNEQGYLKSRIPKRPNAEQIAAAVEIHREWQRICDYPNAALTGPRRNIIYARLREGRTVEEFVRIMEWAAANPYMSGRDPQTSGRRYTDFPNLFATPTKFDKYLTQAEVWEGRGGTTSRKLYAGIENPEGRRL